MREHRVIDAWRPGGKNATNGSILSGGTVVKGNETVGQLPRKFSRIVWYFLSCSEEINVEVISRRQCGRMEVPWQFVFNYSNKVKMKLLKELLVSKS